MPHNTRGGAARGLLLLLAFATLAGAAVAQPRFRTPDVRAAIERATAGLDISASQRADLDRIAARYAGSEEPGMMWRVADEVRAVLTPAQIEQLQQRPRAERRRRGGDDRVERRRRVDDNADARRGERRVRRQHEMGEHRTAGDRVRRMEHGVAEEYRDAARALHEQHRAQMEALRAERESGALDQEAFRERARALHAQMRADIQPMLTEEARRMHAEMSELHDRMLAVRDDVLRLTEEQRAALGEGMHRRRTGGDDALSSLSEAQRATLSVYRALMRGARVHTDRNRPEER